MEPNLRLTSVALLILVLLVANASIFVPKYADAAAPAGVAHMPITPLRALHPNPNFSPPGNSIPLPGCCPWDIAYDSANNEIYVPIAARDIVAVIDTSNNALTTIPFTPGAAPIGVVYDSANNQIYVSSGQLNTVYVIDGTTNKVVNSITVGFNPLFMTYDSANNKIYVTNPSTTYTPGKKDSVSVIDGTTNSVVATIQVGTLPWFIAYDPANNEIYVSNTDSISVIDGKTDTLLTTIPFPAPSEPLGITYNAANKHMYAVTHTFTDTVSEIDGTINKVVNHTSSVGPNAWSVAYNQANNHLDVSNQNPANTVSVINGKTNTLLNNIPVGDSPMGITYNSGNGCVYVANAGYHAPASVSVVDCAVKIPIPFIPPIPCTVNIRCPPLFVFPWMFAYDPIDNNLYTTNSGLGSVTVVNRATDSLVANIKVGAYPTGITYDSSNHQIYVANFGSNTVSSINTMTNRVVANITVGPYPLGLYYNGNNRMIYVSHYGSNTVSLINGTHVTGYINVGSNSTRP